jgi:hypothetical protein
LSPKKWIFVKPTSLRVAGCTIQLALAAAVLSEHSTRLLPLDLAPKMPTKRRKLSELTDDDKTSLLAKLDSFQNLLADNDEELPPGLYDLLGQFRETLETVKVSCVGKLIVGQYYLKTCVSMSPFPKRIRSILQTRRSSLVHYSQLRHN